MVTNIRIHDILSKRALVTRESARPIREALVQAGIGGEIDLDFSGVDAVTPSFVDELLSILADSVGPGVGGIRLVIANPPTRLSEKFAAVARAHGMAIQELEGGSWVLTSSGTQ